MTEARYILAALAVASAGGALLTAPSASGADSWHQVGDFAGATAPIVGSGLGPIYAQPAVHTSAGKPHVAAGAAAAIAAPSLWTSSGSVVRTVVTPVRTVLAVAPHRIATTKATVAKVTHAATTTAKNSAKRHHHSKHTRAE